MTLESGRHELTFKEKMSPGDKMTTRMGTYGRMNLENKGKCS